MYAQYIARLTVAVTNPIIHVCTLKMFGQVPDFHLLATKL